MCFKFANIFSCVSGAVLIVAVLIGGFLLYLESHIPPDSDRNLRMAERATENLEKFKEEGHMAFVVGYTGEVGKALVKHLAKTKPFKRVILIGRREVELPSEAGPEIEQKIVDFEKLEESAEIFKDIDVGFCCLGTTRGKSGKEGFIKVDHDYVMKTAEVSKGAGCRHFNLVSSQGANKNSFMLYPKVKGEVEDEIKALNFDRYSVFRPGLLVCDRVESRPAEAILRAAFKPIAYAFPTAMSIPVEMFAEGMTNNAIVPPASDKPFELFENKAIHQLASKPKKSK